jgi:hypothetical protein
MNLSSRAVVVFTVLVAGCASPPPPTLTATSSSQADCCADSSAIPYQDYSVAALRRIAISEKSPSLPTAVGKRKTAGLKLDLPAQPSILEFLTYREGPFVPTATVFVPTFEFLDATFRSLGTVEPRVYQQTNRLRVKTGTEQSYYGAALVPPNARYVLIYTDDAKLGGHGVPIIQGGGMAADYILDRDRQYYARFSARDFALGRVNPPSADPGTRTISRSKYGEVDVLLSGG